MRSAIPQSKTNTTVIFTNNNNNKIFKNNINITNIPESKITKKKITYSQCDYYLAPLLKNKLLINEVEDNTIQNKPFQEIFTQYTSYYTTDLSDSNTDNHINKKYCCKHCFSKIHDCTVATIITSSNNHEKNSQPIKAFYPRTFQHHVMTNELKNVYSKSWIVKKNYKCPKSSCIYDKYYDFSDLNYICWRYSRKKISNLNQASNNDNTVNIVEYMCRFCQGKNWIKSSNYFHHLLVAHGIKTNTAASTLLNRNHLPSIKCQLLPLPKRIFQHSLRTKFQRIYSNCHYCNMWIRCGFLEYDFSNSYTSNPIKNDNINYYYQNRNRGCIEGLFENYFKHVLHCNLSPYCCEGDNGFY
ncbi:Ecm8p SCDLUD_003724 [Saccharomycodes ludwigii]|uniref:Ecm8p n=1 Tax=Saccharomycodes ludwigii TaxID=36035 RepID=UPI001E840FF5|nr:hypothetical protein SCDLUD_003724 [Saccharomycodes ludwigii]KAH3900721.1 hypothetical protein SCDLUD_003724 [Saccharomycodes ludwigii]